MRRETLFYVSDRGPNRGIAVYLCLGRGRGHVRDGGHDRVSVNVAGGENLVSVIFACPFAANLSISILTFLFAF